MEYRISVEGEWACFSEGDIARMKREGKRRQAEFLEDLVVRYETNPLSYFKPHGRAWCGEEREIGDGLFVLPPSEYPEEYGNDGVALLNDWESDICLFVSPNQVGKSLIGAIWSMLRIVKCDERWPIFRYSVKCPEWRGPKLWVVASYSWDNVGILWRRYREWLPRRELGPYALGWGKYEGENGAAKELSFGDGRNKEIRLKESGSVISFRCYTQRQVHWESFESDGGHLDEQAEKEKWIGLNRSFTTRGDYTPIAMTLTGHVLPMRPDTGAGGWIHRDLWEGRDRKGKKVALYGCGIEDVPDAVISKKRKEQLWDQWANPERLRSEKDERAAVARYWGGWEQGGGLMFESDVWDRRIHLIDPLWPDNKVPKDGTKWRVIDFAETGVLCCSWFYVTRECAFLYRVMYEKGLLVSDAAELIIKMSNNERVLVEENTDEFGRLQREYREVVPHGGEHYYGELLDSRSAKKPVQGDQTLVELFAQYGLENLQPACGQQDHIQIPRLKELMRIDYTRKHPFNKDRNGNPMKGACKLYFFDGRVHGAVEEIETYPAKPTKGDADHWIDTGKYWASDNPAYYGDWWRDEDAAQSIKYAGAGEVMTPYTGH